MYKYHFYEFEYNGKELEYKDYGVKSFEDKKPTFIPYYSIQNIDNQTIIRVYCPLGFTLGRDRIERFKKEVWFQYESEYVSNHPNDIFGKGRYKEETFTFSITEFPKYFKIYKEDLYSK